MSKKILVFALVLTLGLIGLYFSPIYYFSPELKQARAVNKLVSRNITARGGAEAWQAVSSLRQSGLIDVGQGMHLPYLLEQKRPGRMCLEFVFDGETAVQCVDGKTGWKLLPFRGRSTPEPMTRAELREMGDSVDLYGLLFDYAARGLSVELLGQEPVKGRDATKLKVTLPGGTERWLYLDSDTGLEIKLEATRMLRGKEHRVEVFYHDWQAVDGLLIAHRQETQTEGATESRFLTVDSVQVNPLLEDTRFVMPTSIGASSGYTKKVSF